MAGNTFGRIFTVTTFGESHGPAIGCVVDGCPPGLELSVDDIQPDLDRRKPGTSRHVTQRREEDKMEILSGVYEGKTTGTPIALLIRNVDQRSKDYDKIARSFRPGHADYTYMRKLRKSGERVGARLTVAASGVPSRGGEPLYDRLDADIAKVMMGINAVKGVEMGAGFHSVEQLGT